jgi:predicted metal-binding membrane protein
LNTAASSRRGVRIVEAELLFGAMIAWVATVILARHMGVGPGTMGLNVIAFVGSWALMMAAMMLPSIAPFAGLYRRTLVDHHRRRIAALAGGYLGVWVATGFVAYALASGAGHLALGKPGRAKVVGVFSCVICATYQFTPAKERCLQHCRSPLGHLLHYASFRGAFADVRVGAGHGAWCLGCCWSLMVLLVTFGVMNLYAMVVLAFVILVEKVLAPGRWFSIGIGVAALGLGVAIWIDPSLAHGLQHGVMKMTM